MKFLLGAFGRTAYYLAGPFVFPFIISGSKRARIWIVHDKKVLLVQSVIGTQQWNMPGGGIHKGEAAVVAATREVNEELGIVIDPNDCEELFGEDYKSFFATCHQTYFSTALKAQPAIDAQPLEILRYRWFTEEELNDGSFRLHPNVESVLKNR